MTARSQFSVALRSCTVMGGYLACAVLLQEVIASHLEADSWWLSLPLALSAVQGGALISLLAILLAAKLKRAWHARRASRFEARIRQLLSEQSAGADHEAEIVRIYQPERRLVETCLTNLLYSLRGEGKQRLAQLARQLGLISRWQRDTRSPFRERRRFAVYALAESGLPEVGEALRSTLADADLQIRVIAARSLARRSSDEAAKIFIYALSQPLLVRALLAADLKKFAGSLPANGILPPRASRHELLAALEICVSWRRTTHIENLDNLLCDSDAEIAAAAVRLVPFAGLPERQEDQLRTALRHPEPVVRRTAAALLGHVKAGSALADLTRGLTDPDPSVLHACAFALAALGPDAWSVLESEVLTGTPRARVAMEALEAAQTGRLTAVFI